MKQWNGYPAKQRLLECLISSTPVLGEADAVNSLNQKHNAIGSICFQAVRDILLHLSKQHFRFFLKSITPQNLFLNLLQGQTIEAFSPVFTFFFISGDKYNFLKHGKYSSVADIQCFLLGTLSEWESGCKMLSFFHQPRSHCGFTPSRLLETPHSQRSENATVH